MSKLVEAFFDSLKGGNPYVPELGVDDIQHLKDDDVITCGNFIMTKGFLNALADHPDIKRKTNPINKETN